MKKSVMFAVLITVVFSACLSSNLISAALNMTSFDNYTIYLPNQATLAALVTSTYNNSSISYNWTKVSGPGTATFSNQHYSVTDVAFSESGDCVLRLNASDGETSDYRDVNVTVLPEPLRISVKRSGTGAGNVSGIGIDCGSDCSETYDEDSPISLTATAASGSVFIGWVGSGCLGNFSSVCNVTVNGTKEVTAFFDTNTTGIHVYYVATTGSDSNNGSIDFPWQTIQHAADTAVAGDKVIVKAGTYNEFLTFPNSGNTTSPIVFEGERNANGEWFTIVDPSTNASSGWIAAPEIGEGVWKKDVGFNTSELTINNKRVAFVSSMGNEDGEMAYEIGNAYSGAPWTTGAELLNVSTDYLVKQGAAWGESVMRYWDGLEALWGHSDNTTYLRLRNGSNPNGMDIQVTPEQYTFFIHEKSYLDFRNFNVRNINTGFWVESNSHHVTIESNNLSGGSSRVSLWLWSYQNIIRNNEMTANFYGYNDPGVWSAGYRGILRNYQYLVSKFLMGGGTTNDVSVDIVYAGDNNIISGNHLFKSLGSGIQLYGHLEYPSINTEVYDNVIENQPSIGIIFSQGNVYTKIHDNLLIDNNLNLRYMGTNTEGETNRTLFLYRNKFWLPKDSGEHIHISNGGYNLSYASILWAYHNTFVGGFNSFDPGSDPMPKMNFINNIFSGGSYVLGLGSIFEHNASMIGEFDYNFGNIPFTFWGYPTWYGPYNLNQTEFIWDSSSVPDFLLSNNSIAIDAGIDLSQEFTINGTTYPALPGMELGYFTGEAPDMGAVEYNGTEIIHLTALFGTNPINNFNSNSSNITFDFKCYSNVSISAIQLFTNTTGSWQANYANYSYTNNTWLNITVEGIPEGNFKWATFCNDSEGNSDWTNTNRTFTVTLNEEEENDTNPPSSPPAGGGGGGGGAPAKTNTTNQTNQTQGNVSNLNKPSNGGKQIGSGSESAGATTGHGTDLTWLWAIVGILVFSGILTLILVLARKKKEVYQKNVKYKRVQRY